MDGDSACGTRSSFQTTYVEELPDERFERWLETTGLGHEELADRRERPG